MTASTITTVLEDVAAMCAAITNNWNVDAIESGRDNATILDVYSVGKKYIKVVRKLNHESADRTGYVYMFVNKLTGECYGVKSWNQADSLMRGTVKQFTMHPQMCSVYGGFVYIKKRI